MGQALGIARRLDIRWVDVVLAGVLTFWAVLGGSPQDSGGSSPAVLLTTVPLLVRRRWPVAVLAAALLGFGLAGNATNLAALIGGITATVSVGLYSRHQNLALLSVAAAALFIAVEFGHGSTSTLPIPGVVLPALLLGSAYLVGREIGSRQQEIARQRQRADELTVERAEAVKLAAETERRHIARELHDVVAHSVSVMVVQAGAARKVMTEQPDAAKEALGNVETVGHEAMSELRRLLGVLGENGSDPPTAPQPGLRDLEALVERVREAGLPVRVRREGVAVELPAAVDMAAYRIVQEALTNALKYAGGAPTTITVVYQPDRLEIDVIDQGVITSPSEGIGRGLIGMHERVALVGGTIVAGKEPDGGYAVRAHIPLHAS